MCVWGGGGVWVCGCVAITAFFGKKLKEQTTANSQTSVIVFTTKIPNVYPKIGKPCTLK